jgi:hypothetical protein
MAMLSSPRSRVLAAIAAVALLAGIAFLVLGGGDDDEGGTGITGDLPAAPSVPEPVGGDVSVEGEELIALLERGNQGRHHATYAVEGDPAVTGGDVEIEQWRDGGQLRRDTRTTTEEGRAETTGIVDGDDVVSCQRLDEGEWSCQRVDAPEIVDGDLVGSIRSQLVGATVVVTEEEIDGREVRCFAFDTVDGQAELCATDEGIVVRLGVGDTVLTLTDLDDDVPGDIFTPPAEPTEPTDTTATPDTIDTPDTEPD